MFFAVRCPSCLLTVYTTVEEDSRGANGFGVQSLADEDLAFYNCPMPLCDYHISTAQHVHLHRNPPAGQRFINAAGFRIFPRNNETTPFRSQGELAAIATTIGTAQDEGQSSAVTGVCLCKEQGSAVTDCACEEQCACAEQPVQEQPVQEQLALEQFNTKHGLQQQSPRVQYATGNLAAQRAAKGLPKMFKGAAAPGVASAKKSASAAKWTASELQKLTNLSNQGLPHSRIAMEMDRTTGSVKYKLASIREKERLAKLGQGTM